MTQNCALLSMVFMMGFVLLFDRVHQHRGDSRFCRYNLMGAQDIDRILQVLGGCQDS